MMGGLDEFSAAIGRLTESVNNLKDTTEAIWDEMKDQRVSTENKLEALKTDFIAQKVEAARSGGRMGVITAIGAFGAIEGIKYYLRHH